MTTQKAIVKDYKQKLIEETKKFCDAHLVRNIRSFAKK